MFEYTIRVKDKKSKARTGIFHTPHGKLETPELAFVATEGEIKAIPKEILPKLPVRLIIVNTFHIWVKKIIENGRWKKGLEAGQEAGGEKLEKKRSSIFQSPYSPPNPSSNFNIHHYANFPRPIMSDSGGFQVFSMGFGKAHGIGKVASMFPGKNQASNFQLQDQASSFHPLSSNDKNNPLKITEKGVEFTFNEKEILLTPEKSMEIQKEIGADIMFAFDECTSPLNSKAYTKKAMERTHRWLQRCLKVIENRSRKLGIEAGQEDRNRKLDKQNPSSTIQHSNQLPNLNSNFHPQALFAIVQGGYFKDLRKISATYIAELDVPGFGIGGSLGTTEDELRDVLEWTIPYLPDEKPRHLLGIGKVKDIFDGVERGVDLFDCVIPTREARHKVIYTKKGRLQVRKMRSEKEIIEKNCNCIACREKVTWKHLAELFSQKNPQAFFYATVHNIQLFADLMREIRNGIALNKLSILKDKYLRYY